MYKQRNQSEMHSIMYYIYMMYDMYMMYSIMYIMFFLWNSWISTNKMATTFILNLDLNF